AIGSINNLDDSIEVAENELLPVRAKCYARPFVAGFGQLEKFLAGFEIPYADEFAPTGAGQALPIRRELQAARAVAARALECEEQIRRFAFLVGSVVFGAAKCQRQN